MDGYISKPVDENQLLATVAAHTGRGKRAAPESEAGLPPPSDFSKLRDRYSSKPDLLIKLVDAFRETSAQDLDRIEAALRTADSTALEHAAHRLSGGAGFVCADRVKQLAAELETRAAQHQLDDLGELSKQLTREVAESLQGLKRFLETVHAEPKVPSSCGKERAS